MLTLDLQRFAQEKTEKATPKRRQDARKKGQVARSADVPSSLIFLLVFLFLFAAGGAIAGDIVRLFRLPFDEGWVLLEVTPDTVQAIYGEVLSHSAFAVLSVMAASLAAGVLGNYVQIGALFTTEPLKVKVERLNPVQGAKRIFSKRALVEFLKSLLKFVIVAAVVILVLQHNFEDMFKLSRVPVGGTAAAIGKMFVQLGLFVALTLVLLSIPDYMYQRYDHEKNIRMSKQDIKDELKKTEGPPEIKNKMKQKQRQMAMQRMMQEVPKADVIITNPTHYAVALKYEAQEMDAPQVVAKGTDLLAKRMRELAEAHEVPVMENKPLARTLYERLDIGETVPPDLFQAVAEVLAYVYRMRGTRRRS